MKRCFILLSAVCLTAVASALNVTWSGTNVTNNTTQTVFASGAVKKDFSLAAVITLDANFLTNATNNAPIVAVGSGPVNGYTPGILAYNGDGNSAKGLGGLFWADGSGSSAWTSMTEGSATVGDHVVTITGSWNSGAGRWDVEMTIDGNPVAWSQNEGQQQIRPESNALTLTFHSQENAWSLKEVAVYDGLLSQEQIDYLSEKGVAVLPEPTALALLALGVAGVALRRRAA